MTDEERVQLVLEEIWRMRGAPRRYMTHLRQELRMALAIRDDWVCGICHLAIPSYSYPDPESPSIDHIIPRARGGTDVSTNLQIAHLRCNIAKGARVPANA